MSRTFSDLSGYLSEFSGLSAATLSPSALLAARRAPLSPTSLSQQARDAIASVITREPDSMWSLDQTWAGQAEFYSSAQCVRKPDFGGAYVTSPYDNNAGCRNWDGKSVPPACSYAQWRVPGCDLTVFFNALFQYYRYIWAQKQMQALLTNKPSDPEALVDWAILAKQLESVLVYSTNIRFDDDGAWNFFETGRNTYLAELTTQGVFRPNEDVGGELPVRGCGNTLKIDLLRTRYYNSMSVRNLSGALDETQARQIPTDQASFSPFARQIPWALLPAGLSNRSAISSNMDWLSSADRLFASAVADLKTWAKYSIGRGAWIELPRKVRCFSQRGGSSDVAWGETAAYLEGIDGVVSNVEAMLQHYSRVSFVKWQQVAVNRYLLSAQASLPSGVSLTTEELRRNLQAASETLTAANVAETSVREAQSQASAQASALSTNVYMSMLSTIVGAVNAAAGVVFAIEMQIVGALSGWLVEAAGAATGRPPVCPAPPYLRVFSDKTCTLGTEAQISQALSTAAAIAVLTDPTKRKALQENLRLPSNLKIGSSDDTTGGTTKNASGWLVGGATLLLLYKLLR